jgi:hypothetical protein
VTQVPTKTMALVHRRLLAEASTAAWQDYLMFNALLAVLAIAPALLVNSRLWKRSQPLEPSTQPVEAQVQPSAQAGASASHATSDSDSGRPAW